MVVKQSDDGDLFPRSTAPNASARIKKRNGEVLFGPVSKRPKENRQHEIIAPDAADAPVIQYGSTLSVSRLSPGMTVLGLVTKAHAVAIEFVLPSGIRARAIDETLLDDEQLSRVSNPVFRNSLSNVSDSEDDNGSTSTDEEDDIDEKDNNSKTIEEDSDADADGSEIQPLWKLVYVGQVLPVSIIGVENHHGRRVVSVSFRPHLVNVGLNPALLLKKGFSAFAAVLSVEDHGYILSFGSNISHTGFLPFDKCDPPSNACPQLRVGSPVQVVTETNFQTSVNKRRSGSTPVRVSARHFDVDNAVIDMLDHPTFQDLRAGMLLRARFMKEGPGGMSLLSLGVFPISVDAAHIPLSSSGSRNVHVNKYVLTRLLYVDASLKIIGASLLNCFVSNMSPPSVPTNWKTGKLLKPLKVETIKPGHGIFLRLVRKAECEKSATDGAISDDLRSDSEDDDGGSSFKVPIFAHTSRIFDLKLVPLESKFHVGMVVSDGGRVVSVSPLDGIVNIDLRPSILSRKALTIDEVVVGSAYNCKILNHSRSGCLTVAVDGDPHLIGKIPHNHISDVPVLPKMMTKLQIFRVGSTLKCRVVSVDINRNQIFLTARRSLTSPRYPLLTSLEEVALLLQRFNSGEEKNEQLVYSGNVFQVTEKGGILIGFCNGIIGLVPTSELCLNIRDRVIFGSKEKIESMYPVGQTVYVRITSVDLNNRKLYLSMNLGSANVKSPNTLISIGDLVSGTIIDADDDLRHFIVSIKVKNQKSSQEEERDASVADFKNEKSDYAECYIPFGHLSDVPAISDFLSSEVSKLVKTLSKEMRESSLTIDSALVLSIHADTAMLTLKDSLRDASKSGNLPSSYEEVKAVVKGEPEENRKILRGYVKALLPVGVIVGFLGGSVGFIKKSQIADHFVSDPAHVLVVNQSIGTVLQSFDDQRTSFELSSRLSDVGAGPIKDDTVSAFRSFQTWRRLLKIDLNRLKIGDVMKATVESVHTYGVQYALNSAKSKITAVALNVDNNSSPVIEDETSSMSKKERNHKSKTEELKSEDNGDVVGEEKDVCIIDIDPVTGVVDLSRDEDLLSGALKESAIPPGLICDARVLLKKRIYIVLLVKSSKTHSSIAFALGPVMSDSLVIRPGAILKCQILDRSLTQSDRNIAVIDWNSSRGMLMTKLSVNRSLTSDLNTISLLRNISVENESSIIGLKVRGKVTHCFPTHVSVWIAPDVVGRLHISNMATLSIEELKSLSIGALPAEVASRFTLPEVGTILDSLLVVGIRRSTEHVKSRPPLIELAKSEAMAGTPELTKESRVVGFVMNPSSRFLPENDEENSENTNTRTMVTIGCSVVACHDVNCLSSDTSLKLPAGKAVLCLISHIQRNGYLRGCLSENGLDKNGFFLGIVRSVNKSSGLLVLIPWLVHKDDENPMLCGTVGLCDLSKDFDEGAGKMDSLKTGDIVRVRRININKSAASGTDMVPLSMRDEDCEACKDPLLDKRSISGLKSGSKIRGFVSAVTEKGCFVAVGRDVTAVVKLRDLSDEFVHSPELEFPAGKVVSGLVSSISVEKGNVRISLMLRKRPRANLVGPEDRSEYKEGIVVVGVVKKVERFGALMEISPSVWGLLHVSEAEEDKIVEDPFQEWFIGLRLHAVVIKGGKRKLRLGTKRCYFETAGEHREEADKILELNSQAKRSCLDVRDNQVPSTTNIAINYGKEFLRENSNILSNDNEVDREADLKYDTVEDEVGEEEEEIEEGLTNPDLPNIYLEGSEKSTIPLKVETKFDFSEVPKPKLDVAKHDELSESQAHAQSETVDEAKLKRSSRDKREKKRLKEIEETEIRLREESLARDADAPEIAEDYERMLMGEPNSSVLWIRYMAFCLELSQVEKARAIAERALETIALEKETDRTNVWVAYINLEARFGALNAKNVDNNDSFGSKRDAAVFRVFDRGCERVTDVEDFHLQVANALRTTHVKLADKILRQAVRKFKTSENVWIAVGQSRFAEGDINAGRQCLEHALVSLEQYKHIAVISKFAQFEYKYGFAERGRTIFESLVGNFPKRVDIWNIYLDMEIGQCRHEERQAQTVSRTRHLFERFTSLDLSSKKMKFAFKKWLDFEKVYGSVTEEKTVKIRAREYVEKKKQ